MQISIIIPPYLQPYLERCSVVWNYIVVFYAMIITTSKSLYDTMIVQPQSYYQSYFLVLKNFIVPIVAIVLLFWPLVLSITMAILYSWAWFFWIISSIIIGTIQVVYASYQFCMISIDLLGLSLLKSYSVLRHYSFYYLDIAATTTVSTIGRITTSNNNNDNHNNSSTNNTSRHVWIGRKSRRRLWREKLDTAGTYENFLKIRIESKDISSLQNDIQAQQQKQRQKDRIDTALPDISSESNDDHPQQNQQQSNSTMTAATTTSMFLFNNNIHHHNHNTTNTMRRAHSFSMHPSSYLMDHCDIDGQHHIIDTSTSTPTSSPEGSPTNAIRKVPPPRRNLSFSSGDKSPFNVDKQPPSCMDPIVSHELGAKLADLLVTTMMRLKDARLASMYGSDSTNATTTNTNYNHHSTKSSSLTSLHYLLSAVVKRNHLTLDDILIENARSIANTGQYALSNQSRQLIRAYYEEVQKCLDYVADSPLTASATANVSKQQQHSCDGIDSSDSHESDNNNKNSNDKPLSSNPQQHSNHSNDNNTNNSTNNTNAPSYIISPSYDIRRHSELNERIMLIRKMKQNMGRTALMFSGGGAQAMYHLGIIRALIESRLYDDLSVISGTSGGSIAAAMCAMKTSEELYNDVCVPTVSTDFMLNGKMKEQNIRWFPSMFEMISYWMKHQLVVDSSEFGRTCEFYYSDTTFEEAFERTGKHVCITVSASRASGNTAQRLLLNHISTPNVTIASAVRASCALPGVMAPAKLMIKNSDGVLEPFEVDGVEWIDGSVQADLPFQRIATLFAVTSFIVSQTNFHIVPFINKAHSPNHNTIYWQLFQTMEWDIRNRALKLSRLGLFPRIFGQDISKVFKQKYHGNLTIVPRFTTMQTFGLKILSNPTVKDMEGYLKYSQIAIWPYLNAIRDMIRLEKSLDDCLARLEARMRTVAPDLDWSTNCNDDIESIASGSIIQYSNSNANNHSNTAGTSINSTNNNSRSVRISFNSASLMGGGHESTTNKDSDRLRQRVNCLEQENNDLRLQLENMKHMLGEKME